MTKLGSTVTISIQSLPPHSDAPHGTIVLRDGTGSRVFDGRNDGADDEALITAIRQLLKSAR